jgi:hypothetical protein
LPEHSTILRTRRLIEVETHRTVFTWILQVLAAADLIKGKTIGIDATTLEANAALRSIVRRDSGETSAFDSSRRGQTLCFYHGAASRRDRRQSQS